MNSLQRIFDAAWQTFIVEDGPPALDLQGYGEFRCRYLTKEGKKCAVGLVIPDGHPAQQAGDDFNQLVESYPELFPDLVGKTDPSLTSFVDLSEFQMMIHDNLTDRSKGRWKFSNAKRREFYIRCAEQFGLTVPE